MYKHRFGFLAIYGEWVKKICVRAIVISSFGLFPKSKQIRIVKKIKIIIK